MTVFKVNDISYEAGKLDARTQFHIARRLAPLVKGLGEVVASVGGVGEVVDAAQRGAIRGVIARIDPFKLAQPLLDALASMSDEDADYILDKCMSVTRRQGKGDSWGPILAPNGIPMYPDMDFIVMSQIAYHVIQRNLINFTPATA